MIMEDFNKPKIVWGEISDRSKFAYESGGKFIPEATTFLMVGNHLPYLFCVPKIRNYHPIHD